MDYFFNPNLLFSKLIIITTIELLILIAILSMKRAYKENLKKMVQKELEIVKNPVEPEPEMLSDMEEIESVDIGLKKKEMTVENLEDLKNFIDKQKTVFEDYWKLKNIINTSIQLDLTISVDNSNIIKIDQFEETLSSIELVNKFNIFKFDNKKNIYKVIFNGTRDQFLNVIKDYDYFFEIKNKIWVLE